MDVEVGRVDSHDMLEMSGARLKEAAPTCPGSGFVLSYPQAYLLGHSGEGVVITRDMTL